MGVLFSLVFGLSFFAVRADALGSAPAERHVGMRNFGVWDQATGQRLDFAVWYPSRNEGEGNVREGWRILSGKSRRILPGLYPIILLSHDAASSRFANNDLAAALAASGMIVIAPSHTGDSQLASGSLFSAALLQERPRQLLRALDTLLGSPDFAPCADESRIGLLGVGTGAISALQLAGAAPDFSRVSGYCLNAAEGDAFCSSWARERLAAIPAGLDELLKQQPPVNPDNSALSARSAGQGGAARPDLQGRQDRQARQARQPQGKKTGNGRAADRGRELRALLLPPLDAYAPELVPAQPPPPEHTEPEEKPKAESKRNVSLKEFLFGTKEEPGGGDALSAAAAQLEEKRAALAASLAMAFQGLSLFGDKEEGASFLHIDLPEGFEPAAVDGAGESEVASRQKVKVRRADPRYTAYRRDPSVRRIGAVGLLAPAGGMLYSPEALSGVSVPVAILAAGSDGLYPVQGHALPYRERLPAPPLTLSLAGVDHFSLFAPCAREDMDALGAICGRLSGLAREDAADERDLFFTSFFRSVLGEAREPALPSGFVARDGEL